MKSPVVCPHSVLIRSSLSAGNSVLRSAARWCAAAALLAGASGVAQVVTIDNQGNAVDGNHAGTVDRRFAQIEPTHVELPKTSLDPKTRLEVIRIMTAEQGF